MTHIGFSLQALKVLFIITVKVLFRRILPSPSDIDIAKETEKDKEKSIPVSCFPNAISSKLKVGSRMWNTWLIRYFVSVLMNRRGKVKNDIRNKVIEEKSLVAH